MIGPSTCERAAEWRVEENKKIASSLSQCGLDQSRFQGRHWGRWMTFESIWSRHTDLMEILTAKCMHSYRRGQGKRAGDFDLWDFVPGLTPLLCSLLMSPYSGKSKTVAKVGREMTWQQLRDNRPRAHLCGRWWIPGWMLRACWPLSLAFCSETEGQTERPPETLLYTALFDIACIHFSF